MCELD